MTTSAKLALVKESDSLEKLLEIFLSTPGDLVFLDENTVVSNPHLELLTDYPRRNAAALVARSLELADSRVAKGAVESMSSASHTVSSPNRQFLGALFLPKSQRREIEIAISKAIEFRKSGHPLELFLVALVRSAIRVDAVDVIGASYARSSDNIVRKATLEQIAKTKDSALRLKLANRANDGFYSVFVLRRISKVFTWIAIKLGVSPNQVTVISFAIGLAAAVLFATGEFWSLIVGAVLLQLSIVVDCVDGELARYTRKFSQLGAWLDAITDRAKEYAVFLGLAYGAYVQQGLDYWLAAMILMTIQTFRHLSDYNFSQVIKIRNSETPPIMVSFENSFDGGVVDDQKNSPDSANYLIKRVRFWLGKIVTFPIGERWLVISLSAAMGGAALVFPAMITLALVSMVWVYRVRIIKSLQLPKMQIQSSLISWQHDLGSYRESFLRRFDWIEPSLLRLVELVVLVLLFSISGNLGVSSFVILFSIAFHHYDNLYRAMQNEHKPGWLMWAGLTSPGRIILFAALSFLGIDLLLPAVYFSILFVLLSSAQWVGSRKKLS